MNALSEWMTTTNAPKSNRYYLRCHDCLLTTCIEMNGPRNDLVCHICGGIFECLGSVTGNRWQHQVKECVCNEQCQDAKGPKCTCSCGGENHGKSYRYRLHTDAQGRIHVETDVDVEKHLRIANEYREAEKSAIERINALPHKSEYDCGKWIDRVAWNHIHNAIIILNVARKGAQHKSRMTKLAKVAA